MLKVKYSSTQELKVLAHYSTEIPTFFITECDSRVIDMIQVGRENLYKMADNLSKVLINENVLL